MGLRNDYHNQPEEEIPRRPQPGALTKTAKLWIDGATYEALLRRWRFTEYGGRDGIFIGQSGNYYHNVMQEKKAELTNDEQVRISKLVGWSDV